MIEQQTQQKGALAYIMLTEAQLRQVAEDGARTVLERFGVNTEEVRDKLILDDKDEYKPVSYWLKKMDVNRTTIWRWQKEGLITPRYVGRKVFFRQTDFDQMFAIQCNFFNCRVNLRLYTFINGSRNIPQ